MTNVTDNATNVIPLDDTREKLEDDVRKLLQSAYVYAWMHGYENRRGCSFEKLHSEFYNLLDRQDAIMQRECIDRWDAKATLEVVELQAKVDELTEERDQLLDQAERYAEEAANFEQQLAERDGAVCERDGRINAYERRNTELNDALKAICNRYGVSTQWAAEDVAKKVFESTDSAYMRLPVDADGVLIRPGDVLDMPMNSNGGAMYRMTVENVIWDGAD